MNMLQVLADKVAKRFTNVNISIDEPSPLSVSGYWFMDIIGNDRRWAIIEWHPIDGGMGLVSHVDYKDKDEVAYGDGVKELFTSGNIVDNVFNRLEEIME